MSISPLLDLEDLLLRKVKRSEALARDNQHRALRELNWHIDDDGSYVLKARLSPEQGARITQALEAATSAIREEQYNAAETSRTGWRMQTAPHWI